MGEHGFGISLVSNMEFSKQLYPENTDAKFRTRLFSTIELQGEYEIALTEIQFTMSFYNVNATDCYIDAFSMDEYGMKSNYESYTLPKGNYTDLEQFVLHLNSLDIIKNNVSFKYNKDTDHVEVESSDSRQRKFVDLSLGLRAMLGFKLGEECLKEGPAPKPANLYANVRQQLFVYCDLVEPQLVGDSAECLLKTVGIEDITNFGSLVVKTYDSPDYVPIQRTHFQTIELDIRTFDDKPAPFEFGPSLVKVHIRRARSRR